MWPPTEAVLRHHEQQQRHTTTSVQQLIDKMKSRKSSTERASSGGDARTCILFRHSRALRAVASLRYGRTGSDHGFDVAGHGLRSKASLKNSSRL